MNGEAVEKETFAKDLGVKVDDKLTWSEQIKYVVGKAKRRGYCMSRALISKNAKTWTLLYKGYIRSILEYALTAYCPYQRGHLDALERVQRWMTRQIPGIGKRPYEKRREICNLSTIEDRMTRGLAIEMFKIRNNLSGISKDRFSEINHQYNSRSISSQNVYQELAKSDKRKYAFTCRSSSIWRKIPSEVKKCTTTLAFKVAYDSWNKNVTQ